MKFTIFKESLLKGLQIVQSVISTHSTLPILYNVLIKIDKGNLSIIATDLSLSIKFSMDIDTTKSCASTFQARRLLNIIRELPDENIDIDIDDKDTAAIHCGSSAYKVLGLSADEFPPLPSFESAGSFSMEQATFKEMLKKTVYAASMDESRQMLNGVLLSFKDQKLTMVATDGRRLALIEQEMEIPGDAQTEVVIPTKAVNELIKVLGDEGTLQIRTLTNLASFDMGQVLVVTKLIDGSYPNFRQVIPSHCDERVAVDRESFLAALRRVALMTNDKYPSIKVSFEKNQMNISAVTPDVGEARESVPIKYTGKQITMAFNPEFIIDPLRNLTSDEVNIELVDELSPAIVKCDIPFLYVLMPLRVS
ncbi:MAG: DNA polymerase III subunit beta [Verrucomicrobia bacterium]|nr:DNA polymerase III subunit beta [Verrucomicrobiota bacterium]MCG2680838.1 DNA polymerase III subunit beta [Kiritimatiellia bacterium]MBU4246848.1 DNA polymerase III subunit beta [Verrucomicrobiota bacterium]MBU4290406.1 DNA polymerase III subunit beta [Verrucomicrobiota bacterium]MBU4430257.1 DNA polymerase III subunit beta [Verrucomicrobiota bacterium]